MEERLGDLKASHELRKSMLREKDKQIEDLLKTRPQDACTSSSSSKGITEWDLALCLNIDLPFIPSDQVIKYFRAMVTHYDNTESKSRYDVENGSIDLEQVSFLFTCINRYYHLHCNYMHIQVVCK